MGKLVYSMMQSLDGYTDDEDLVEEHRFGNGVVVLRHAVRS